MKSPARIPAGSTPRTVLAVGDNCVSEAGMAAIVSRDKRYRVCGAAHRFSDAAELIRQHRPDILLIEPFMEDRDGILWIKELAKKYPHTRILIVSRQSERVYAERALHAGAAGYWMKNGSAEELMRAIETVAEGKIYVSQAISALAIEKFARNGEPDRDLDRLSDRELTVFSLIADGHGIGRIALELGLSRKTIETHCDHIKVKLGYANSEELKRGARKLFGRR